MEQGPGDSIRALGLELTWSADGPVALARVDGSALVAGAGGALVEIFTADEQRARTSQGYVRSAVGRRLRYVGHTVHDGGRSARLDILQRDPRSGIDVTTTIERPAGLDAWRITPAVRNGGDQPVVLLAVTSASIGFGEGQAALAGMRVLWGESEWLAEGRWHSTPVRDVLPDLALARHGQDGRGRWTRTSHGAWSTGELLPGGVLIAGDEALGWQIETSAAWHWELTQTLRGGVLSLLGPAATEHSFAHELQPGEEFIAVSVAIVHSTEGTDGAFAGLTRYRRWLREPRADTAFPVVYNDFMNTLMGDPSTEKLMPLITAAADAGAEYFCIDAGWFADRDGGDWWSDVGSWREAPARFTGGLNSVIRAIHDSGMRSGLWLEPEVVGVRSEIASTLPEAAFFHRYGRRVREHDRYHLDFRHPEARRHLDETVDHLVATYGISYLKLDYNINPGAGTELAATDVGAGLLGHTRAFRAWLRDLQQRHPSLLVENCASGAMRMDYSLLSVTHLQSTSDQQDFRRYPPIAVSAPASMLPEQCGNWAYPAVEMTDEETAFALVAGVMGRLYLSGFLHTLRPAQDRLVREAVSVHKRLRAAIAQALPFWPLGLPGWDDDVLALGLDTGTEQLVAVWNRAGERRTAQLAGVRGTATTVFPARIGEDGWQVSAGRNTLDVSMPPGPTARVLRVPAS